MRSSTPPRTQIMSIIVLLMLTSVGWGQTPSRPGPARMTAPGNGPSQVNRLRQIETGRNVNAAAYPVSPGTQGRTASGVIPTSYVPQHMRMAQNESSIMQNAPAAQPMNGGQLGNGIDIVGTPAPGNCASCNSTGCAACMGGSALGQSYFAPETLMDCDSCGDVGCNSCLSSCDRGGCPPELIGDCWIGSLGQLLYKAEYFAGAHGFTSPAYSIPGANGLNDDSSFGFNAGANVGIPLCRITCGLLSGQVGVRTVNSEFSGTPFSSDNREQLFVTTGFYRRVDSGLQLGVVGDFMYENWYTDTTVIQIRGDLGWVYYGGNTLGFRFSENVQDDVSNGVYNGTAFTGLVTSSLDNYRFYYRQNMSFGGYSDLFLGWSDEKHVVGGLEYDLPMGECWALQSSFTYFMPENDDQLSRSGGNANEAWNVAVGFVFRPQGRAWYHNYDRPILPVADNGSMVLRRRF